MLYLLYFYIYIFLFLWRARPIHPNSDSLASPCKDLHDHIGLTLIILDNLPISDPHISAKSPLLCKVTFSQV